MPTTSPDVGNRTTTDSDNRRDNLDEAHRSMQRGEAFGEEAVASMVSALSELVRAFMPGIVTEPVRTLDNVFEAVQQVISLQRRLVRELMANAQLAMADAASDEPYWTRSGFHGADPNTRAARTSSRTAA